jgi:purine-binding chemotaxis protein CheW
MAKHKPCKRWLDDSPMNEKEKNLQTLAEPDSALLGYLQTLLDEIPEQEAAPPKPPIARPRPVRQKAKAPSVVAKTAPQVKIPAAPPTPESKPVVEANTQAAALPSWAQGPFQVLHFEAGGGQLSIPLICMRSIVRLDTELTKLPGHPAWHLGLLMVRGEKIGVVDLARLLAPHAAPRELSAGGFLLILGDGSWGLACERIGDARNIFPDSIRWRKQGAHTPYIHGVISDTLTPLLNTDDVLKTLTRFQRRA